MPGGRDDLLDDLTVRGLPVAIQGGRGSWSEESLLDRFPRARLVRRASVGAAWSAVGEGRAALAWLAVRNSTTGDIAATRSVRRSAALCLEHTYPVPHALLARRGLDLQDVDGVAGHPQALLQCKARLADLVPWAPWRATVDGAHAARRLAWGDRTAVLASARLAPRLGLKVLEACVADAPGNATTFQLLAPVG